jgi:protein SEY1
VISTESTNRTTGRTLLLFVIRDHIGQTPLANLEATLTSDLKHIWDSLSKPTELKDRQLSDYFDLAFTALPHKILSTDKFESGVQELRTRFVDKTSPNYLFKPLYHKRIPADGVAFYMEGIWVSFSQLHNLTMSRGILTFLTRRNKYKRTRISIYPLSKNCWHNSDVTRFRQ